MKRLLLMLRLAIGFALLAACAGPMQPAGPFMPQPRDLASSTVRVDALLDGERVWSGTGWIPQLDWTPDQSPVVTAGHVCDSEVALDFEAVDRWGVHYRLEIDRISRFADLCLLHTLKPLPGRPLALALQPPEYDEPLVMVSAPLGIWGCDTGATLEPCGNAPISRGWYAGGYTAALPSTGGSSGAAILSADGVIGVLVEGYHQYPALAFYEPASHVRTFLYGEAAP